MSRQARLVIPGLPHHVITRGNNRRRLFSFSSDHLRFIHHLERALAPGRCHLHALTLMPNHVHMILTPADDVSLAAVVKRFSQCYAQYRNHRRAATGKLFESRYLSIPIWSERQLAVTTAYVDLNAVRAGLVGEPDDHRWSTFSLHAGIGARASIPPSLWTPSDWYLGLGSTAELRAARYREWVGECRARDERPEWARTCHEIEALSSEPYGHRLLRPDGTRAAEPVSRYASESDFVAVCTRAPKSRGDSEDSRRERVPRRGRFGRSGGWGRGRARARRPSGG